MRVLLASALGAQADTLAIREAFKEGWLKREAQTQFASLAFPTDLASIAEGASPKLFSHNMPLCLPDIDAMDAAGSSQKLGQDLRNHLEGHDTCILALGATDFFDRGVGMLRGLLQTEVGEDDKEQWCQSLNRASDMLSSLDLRVWCESELSLLQAGHAQAHHVSEETPTSSSGGYRNLEVWTEGWRKNRQLPVLENPRGSTLGSTLAYAPGTGMCGGASWLLNALGARLEPMAQGSLNDCVLDVSALGNEKNTSGFDLVIGFTHHLDAGGVWPSAMQTLYERYCASEALPFVVIAQECWLNREQIKSLGIDAYYQINNNRDDWVKRGITAAQTWFMEM
ncbi:MAG: hypothetical protein Q4G30_02910 [Actinomycetaceae bacterium]|nr:hypothetical protein [Actinomycetaceae bacterium]